MMFFLTQRRTGILTITGGIAAALTMVVVLTGFTSGSWLLGGLGDLLDILNSALVIPLFIFLGNLVTSENNILGRTVQALGVIGALTRLTGALLILSGAIVYEEAVLLVNSGMALMGIALLIFLPVSRGKVKLGTVYLLFSLTVSLAMAISLLSVFLNKAYEPLLQGDVGLTELPPFLLGLLLCAPIQMLGYPVWLLWTGRRLLREPENEVVLPDTLHEVHPG